MPWRRGPARSPASIAEALDYVGVLAVEMFVAAGRTAPTVLVNEIAPRVHNSGHWTIDGASVSQFEQHIRAIAGWPLGAPVRHGPVDMDNLIGDEVDDYEKWLTVPGASVHLYGKRTPAPAARWAMSRGRQRLRPAAAVTAGARAEPAVFPRSDERSPFRGGLSRFGLIHRAPLRSRAWPSVGPWLFQKFNRFNQRGCRVQVLVRDNNVDQALKALKKKMQREGIFREMKLRGHYEKPSEKKAREKAEAVRRARKLARKKLQREGLLPMKPKPVFGAGPGGDRRGPGAGPGAGPRPAR